MSFVTLQIAKYADSLKVSACCYTSVAIDTKISVDLNERRFVIPEMLMNSFFVGPKL